MPKLTTNLDQLLQTAIQHHQAGRLAEAEELYRQILAQQPSHCRAQSNLAVALQGKGQLDEAISAYRQAITLNPQFPEAYYDLGNLLYGKGQLDEAIAAYRQAIVVRPNYPEAEYNLGLTLHGSGQLDEAIVAYRQAIALRPSFLEAHNNLGNALQEKGRLIEAVAAFRNAITLRPNSPEAHNNLGSALIGIGQSDEALASCRQAIALDPNFHEAYNNIGNALKEQGQLDEAVAAYRQAIALRPDFTEAHSNLLFILNYHPAFDAHAIAAEARNWNQQFAEPLRKFIVAHNNERAPNRRLRIGYVSPDFREHPVGRFMLPLLACHDHQNFEIFCYAQVLTPDAVTQQLRAHADHWYNIVGLSDQQAAELIRQHQIDILVDLTMHMANNRLLLFARKPAPLQVTYLAYCSTTGLNAIDCRLSDPYLDPAGMDESLYSEQTIHLPRTYWCYEATGSPSIDAVPAFTAGHITFGCLNNFCKVTQPTLTAWAALLRSVPNSQLLLHAQEGSHRQRITDLFQKSGIDPRRLRFVGKVSMTDYLNLYQQIDIALDPFPYGGGTTTCDALWMGVPVVSLRGDTAVGRGGFSILTNVGFPELVATTREQYIQIAADLANDSPRLTELRTTLRERMQQSPLMDATGFARGIESAYRQMWNQWCTKQS